jgi:hypothetical protein
VWVLAEASSIVNEADTRPAELDVLLLVLWLWLWL